VSGDSGVEKYAPFGVVQYLGKYRDTISDDTSIAEIMVYRSATIPQKNTVGVMK